MHRHLTSIYIYANSAQVECPCQITCKRCVSERNLGVSDKITLSDDESDSSGKRIRAGSSADKPYPILSYRLLQQLASSCWVVRADTSRSFHRTKP